MITLEQVKLLEEKVESLISVVKSLYKERDFLKETLTQKEKRVEELEATLCSFEVAQSKIEESVMSTLNQLDVFENSVTHDSASEIVQSEEEALSATSELTQVEGHNSDTLDDNTHNDSFAENERQKLNDSDKQMDIF